MNLEQTLFSTVDQQYGSALAMAYVPIQAFDATYTPEVALSRGTLFPDLDKPFCGRTVMGGERRG